jgi:hypothetical protein
MLIAEWLHLVQDFSTEYHNSRQNIIILFWKYLVSIFRSKAWRKLFWEYINGKLFAVYVHFLSALLYKKSHLAYGVWDCEGSCEKT